MSETYLQKLFLIYRRNGNVLIFFQVKGTFRKGWHRNSRSNVVRKTVAFGWNPKKILVAFIVVVRIVVDAYGIGSFWQSSKSYRN